MPRTYPKKQMSRKARFRAALGLAQLTANQWAEEHGVKGSHLSRVVNGERESERLIAEIDAFIRKQLGEAA